MSVKKFLRRRSKHLDLIRICSCILFSLLLMVACGGSGGGGGGDGDPTDPPVTPVDATWQQSDILATATTDGASVRPVAKPDGDDLLYLAYFDLSGDTGSDPAIQFTTIQLSEGRAVNLEPETNIVTIDNSGTLGLALDANASPVMTYRGGTNRVTFCQGDQNDVMASIPNADGWNEYLAAMGFNPRNPAPQLQDGMVGDISDIAIDQNNNAHIIYTFLYEGCETINHKYLDLRYVRVDAQAPDEAPEGGSPTEETVQGNDYPEFNVVEGHNSVGHFAKIVLDADDRPLVFYDELALNIDNIINHDQGLHLASKDTLADDWVVEWVEQDVEVKAISAAVSSDGTIGVAYAVFLEEGNLDRHELRYAHRDMDGVWHPVVVDSSASVGTHCSLAFTNSGEPCIAYYTIKSHTGTTIQYRLRFASHSASGWAHENVELSGNVGNFNNLWFDSNDAPHVVTYNDSTNEILHLVKQ